MGFMEAGTSWKEYSKYILGYRSHGADQSNSSYWHETMLSYDVYMSPAFVNIVKFMMVAINIYFFFIRMNALP
jgi:hypothetical protein